jgi:cyclopropane fatty-acyl-phospholipid synthase-like methyltransferase
MILHLIEQEGDDNWMGKYFFTGGTMPSEHLFLFVSHPLKIVNQWAVNGVHYSKTLEVIFGNLASHQTLGVRSRSWDAKCVAVVHALKMPQLICVQCLAYGLGFTVWDLGLRLPRAHPQLAPSTVFRFLGN